MPGAVTVYLKDSLGRLVEYTAVRSSLHKQNILLRLHGLENISLVETMVGGSVWMAKSELPELEDEQFYWSDLEGVDVVDKQLGQIGQIVGMFKTPAHDILEVSGPRGEVLIPAVEPFLAGLDQEGCLVVDLPDGLVPEPDEAE